MVVEHPSLQDGSTEAWPADTVASHVRDFVQKFGIKTVRAASVSVPATLAAMYCCIYIRHRQHLRQLQRSAFTAVREVDDDLAGAKSRSKHRLELMQAGGWWLRRDFIFVEMGRSGSLSVATSTHTSDFVVVRRMYLKYNRCCLLASRGLSTLRAPPHENRVLRALELNFEPCSPSIGWCVLTNHTTQHSPCPWC